MSGWEIAGGIILLVLGVIINVVCLMQEQKPQSASSALSGSMDTSSFYSQNKGRTKEARLAKLTRNLSIIMVVVVLLMNIVLPIVEKYAK